MRARADICVHVNAVAKLETFFGKNNIFPKKECACTHIAYARKSFYICTAMTNEKKNPTVFDVAREAGVSRGTVDRVIHRRGRFSAETEARVRDAIQRLGYSANLNAAKLASRRLRRIACLIPSFKEGEYWDYIHQGLVAAAGELGFNLDLQMFLYDQTSVESFRDNARQLLDATPDGVIMNAVFVDEVKAFAGELGEKGIPFAFIDNNVEGLSNRLYVGFDVYRCGELGAFLLTLSGSPKEILLVRILRDKDHRGDPNRVRRQGFTDYIRRNHPGTVVHTLFVDPTVPESITPALEDFLKGHPGVKHLATTNSRIHLCAPFLSAHPDIRAVGFDDLEKNLKALREGSVDFLVTHRIKDISRECLRLFAESLSTGEIPQRRNHMIHLDILHRLNLDGYTNNSTQIK